MEILKIKNADGSWTSVPAIKGDPGVGVPTGGSAGQILKKASNDDYDAEWVDESSHDVNPFLVPRTTSYVSSSSYDGVYCATVEELVENLKLGYQVWTGRELTLQGSDFGDIYGEIGWVYWYSWNSTNKTWECSLWRSYSSVSMQDKIAMVWQGALYTAPINQGIVFTQRLPGTLGFRSDKLDATSIGGAVDELATTRIADSLVSEETTPSVNNTINWQYE